MPVLKQWVGAQTHLPILSQSSQADHQFPCLLEALFCSRKPTQLVFKFWLSHLLIIRHWTYPWIFLSLSFLNYEMWMTLSVVSLLRSLRMVTIESSKVLLSHSNILGNHGHYNYHYYYCFLTFPLSSHLYFLQSGHREAKQEFKSKDGIRIWKEKPNW